MQLVDAASQLPVKTLYTSEPLSKYQWDRGDPYSPPIHAYSGPGLAIANEKPIYVRILVKNSGHNLQIPIDPKLGLNVSVGWAAGPKLFTHAQFGDGSEL